MPAVKRAIMALPMSSNSINGVSRMRCSASARREDIGILRPSDRAREWCIADPGPPKYEIVAVPALRLFSDACRRGQRRATAVRDIGYPLAAFAHPTRAFRFA